MSQILVLTWGRKSWVDFGLTTPVHPAHLCPMLSAVVRLAQRAPD